MADSRQFSVESASANRQPCIFPAVDPDVALAPGGTVIRGIAGATLKLGAYVYQDSTTGKWLTSTTRTNYLSTTGVVVGGDTLNPDRECFFSQSLVDAEITAAVLDGYVYIQVAGIAVVLAGGTIAIGDRVVADDDAAGRVETATTGNILGKALTVGADGEPMLIFIEHYEDTTGSGFDTITFTTSATSQAGFIGLGTTANLPASGAIRIDGASYTNLVFSTINGTAAFKINNTTTGAQLGTYSAHDFSLVANSINKFSILSEAAGTASLKSLELVGRIIGGGTSIALRDNANARDNILIPDAGTSITLSNGTTTGQINLITAAGDLLAGAAYGTSTTAHGSYLRTLQSGVVSVAGIAYFDGTVSRSAFEVINVASGFSIGKLMKAGGQTTLGGGTTGATMQTNAIKAVTAIADATATAVLTVTVPNAAHSASILVTALGSLGAGGAIGANEASAQNSYLITVARTAGVDTVKAVSTAFGAAAAAVAGAATVTCTVDTSTLTGAIGATQTFTIRVTITRSGGSSANHTALIKAEILNANATGVTVA